MDKKEDITFKKVMNAYSDKKSHDASKNKEAVSGTLGEKLNNSHSPHSDPLTEEQQFLEEVLLAQEQALQEERERRAAGKPPKKKLNIGARIIILLMSLTLIFSMFAFIFEMYSIPAIEFLKTSARLSGDETVQEYKKSVVEVSTGSSKGTGFSISEDGYIVTNSHVVDDALQLSVVFPDEGLMEAELVADYPEVDLAVLKVDRTGLPYLPLAGTLEEVQQHVIFIGNPLAFTGIANEGDVIGFTTTKLETEISMLDAPVYKGNSGSPVIASDGTVIGVIYATLNHDEYGKVGLIIPIDTFHERFQLDE